MISKPLMMLFVRYDGVEIALNTLHIIGIEPASDPLQSKIWMAGGDDIVVQEEFSSISTRLEWYE